MLAVVGDARVLAGDGHAAWSESFNEMFMQVAGAFSNARVRRHGRAYVLGLLSQAERKNSWQLAELAGDASPDGMQRLLNFSPWDEYAARDALARYVVRALGDPAAVLAVDETGFIKKGRMSAGVARQYTGTAGRIENCQVGVFAAYVTPDGGRALIDRELYLPEKWTADRDRCRAAGIGDDVAFATKPELARKVIARAREAGIPFSWVAGDEVYGGNPKLRSWLEEQGIPYVMATACSDVVSLAAGRTRADEAAALVPKDGWQRLSCADGSKGPRLYDWALVGTASPGHHLLVRRSLRPGEKGTLELAFFRCWSPRPVTLPELAAVAGARWGIEDCFAEAKGEAGLDHYQVRKYRAWYRHATLSMLAHAFLAVTARASRLGTPPPEPAAASGNSQAGTAKKGT
jgi:SRSO17 transposase